MGGFARFNLLTMKWGILSVEGTFQPFGTKATNRRGFTFFPVEQEVIVATREKRSSVSGSVGIRTRTAPIYFRIAGTISRIRREYSSVERDTLGVVLEQRSSDARATGFGVDGHLGFRLLNIGRASVALEGKGSVIFLPDGGGTFPALGLGVVVGF
jgi:hypothetical protein